MPLAVRRRALRGAVAVLAAVALVRTVGAVLGADAAPAAPGPASLADEAPTVRRGPVEAVVRADGTRAPAPEDLVGWLRADPRLRVLAVRPMHGGGWGSGGVDTWRGIRALSVDYELAAAAPVSPARLFGVPLLCDTTGCTRLVPGVRVRTTVVLAGGETVATVESRWVPQPGEDDPYGRMPAEQRGRHLDVLLGVVREVAAARGDA